VLGVKLELIEFTAAVTFDPTAKTLSKKLGALGISGTSETGNPGAAIAGLLKSQ
jgi:hypothetical protein